MANRCLNKVMLIGNLTRDPELRYTPSGTAVVTLGVATNRRWKTQAGDYKDEAQFHRVVAWNKLAELCSQLLKKGSRIYIEGRIQYRDWEDNEGNKRQTTEVVAGDLIILDSRGGPAHPEDVDAQVDQTDNLSPAASGSEDAGAKAESSLAASSQGDIQTTDDKQGSEPAADSSLPAPTAPAADLVKEDEKKTELASEEDEASKPDKDKGAKEGDKAKKDMPF